MDKDDLPTPVHIPNNALGAAESLQRVEQIRRGVVDRLLEDEDILDDPKMLKQLASMLDSTDRQALGVMRIEAMQSAANGIGDLATALDAIVINQGGGFKRPPDEAIEGGYRPPVPELPAMELKPGVLDPVGTAVDILELLDKDLEKRQE